MPLLLQLSIALFTGMVASTFVPSIRRSVPWPAEVALWLALITACALGVMSVTDHNARDLNITAVWGAEQLLNTIIGLLLAGIGGSIYDHRFTIAGALIVVAGADILALIVLRSMRRATPWAPRVHLGDWMEIPSPAAPTLDSARETAKRSLPDVSTGIAGAMVVLTSAVLGLWAWLQEARRSRASRIERVSSRLRLDSMRDAAAHVRFAASAWYEGAGRPAVDTAAAWTARTVGHGLVGPAAERAGHVIDIRALISAQSLGWYGPLGLRPVETTGATRIRLTRENETDDDERDARRPDTLAS